MSYILCFESPVSKVHCICEPIFVIKGFKGKLGKAEEHQA